jgi:hypothetical protein
MATTTFKMVGEVKMDDNNNNGESRKVISKSNPGSLKKPQKSEVNRSL